MLTGRALRWFSSAAVTHRLSRARTRAICAMGWDAAYHQGETVLVVGFSSPLVECLTVAVLRKMGSPEYLTRARACLPQKPWLWSVKDSPMDTRIQHR